MPLHQGQGCLPSLAAWVLLDLAVSEAGRKEPRSETTRILLLGRLSCAAVEQGAVPFTLLLVAVISAPQMPHPPLPQMPWLP